MKLELDVPPFKDYQTEIRFKSCLNYVIDHFYEVEPLIQEYWLKSELKKLEAEKKKKLEKDKAISEDEAKKGYDEVQKITDNYSTKIDDAVKAKEAELLKV